MTSLQGSQLPPRLMATVSNPYELDLAIEEGADLVDLIWQAGSPSILASYLPEEFTGFRRVGRCAHLGELTDWAPCPAGRFLPSEIQWARIGFAGMLTQPDWARRWRAFQKEFCRASCLHGKRHPLKWIPVAYADHQNSRSPHWEELLNEALETGCSGFMLDVSPGCAHSLPDLWAPQEICRLSQRVRESQLPLFLGGKLTVDDLPWACDLEPDVIVLASTHEPSANPQRRPRWSQRTVAEFRQHLDALTAPLEVCSAAMPLRGPSDSLSMG